MPSVNKIFFGDSAKILSKTGLLPDNCVNLIMTSPPYADKRSKSYGGIQADKYVEWFLPISLQLNRVLKDSALLCSTSKNIQKVASAKPTLWN